MAFLSTAMSFGAERETKVIQVEVGSTVMVLVQYGISLLCRR